MIGSHLTTEGLSFLKHAMARVTLLSRLGAESHVADRLAKRVGLNPRQIKHVEDQLAKMFRQVGGDVSLGSGDFIVPVRVGNQAEKPLLGNLIIKERDHTGSHTVGTFLDPHMKTEAVKDLTESALDNPQRYELKKNINKLFTSVVPEAKIRALEAAPPPAPAPVTPPSPRPAPMGTQSFRPAPMRTAPFGRGPSGPKPR